MPWEQLPEKNLNLLKELIYCAPVSANPTCTVMFSEVMGERKNQTVSWIKTLQYSTTKWNDDLACQ